MFLVVWHRRTLKGAAHLVKYALHPGTCFVFDGQETTTRTGASGEGGAFVGGEEADGRRDRRAPCSNSWDERYVLSHDMLLSGQVESWSGEGRGVSPKVRERDFMTNVEPEGRLSDPHFCRSPRQIRTHPMCHKRTVITQRGKIGERHRDAPQARFRSGRALD